MTSTNPTGDDQVVGEPTGRIHVRVPRGSASVGRLQITRGLDDVKIQADRRLDDLLDVRSMWRAPRVTADGGDLTLAYSRFRRAMPGTDWITLNTSVPWDISVQGGVRHVGADLSLVKLRSLRISRGASRLVLILGKPEGIVDLDLRSADRLTIRRPENTQVRVHIAKGASQVAIDDQTFQAIGGDTVLTTGPILANAYNLRVHGARRLRVNTI